MKQKFYAAVDLGASNGRTILGSFDGQKLSLKELNRFENNYVKVNGSYYWDVLGLFENIKKGLGICKKLEAENLSGVGIDTWGVDFGLLDSNGRLVGNPYAYRDKRGLRGRDAFFEKYGSRAAFDVNGIANLEFNTIYQLYDMVLNKDPHLMIADKLLLMPDLLAYMLCGRVSCEYTDATTTQMLDTEGGWSSKLIDMIGIDKSLLPQIQMSGETKGLMFDDIKQETGLKGDVPIFCVGSHDTASAVASVPASSDSYAYISSGTWSLIGIEKNKALINDTVYEGGFSNEGAITGGVKLLKNIMGLWILQNCKRVWDKEKKLSWSEIVELAEQGKEFGSIIDVNAHEFFDGEGMPGKIQKYCMDTHQSVPQSIGQIARTVYESLALSYAEAFSVMEQIKGERLDALHIVGGGANNAMLNQMTANAIGIPVTAGPSEATAIGNLMVQVMASGEVDDIPQMREVIRDSFDVMVYEPKNTEAWQEHYDRYLKIKQRG